MVRVLAINNYPNTERFEKLGRCLGDNGAQVTTMEWKEASASAFDRFDGVMLSGSPDMLSKQRTREKYSAEIMAISESKAPILGICFGHQMISVAFGSEVVEDKENVVRFVKTEALTFDPLFQGAPSPMSLLESRHEVVKSLPEGFRLLAKSETSALAAIRHSKLPIYGVQAHPERYTSEHPDGFNIVGNFVRMLR